MMGLLRLLWIRLKAVFACVWAMLGRVLCCFRRRRKLSNCGPPTSVDVQPVPASPQAGQEEAGTWSWEEPSGVVTVEDKIRAYREAKQRLSESEPPPEPDFFSDMTPKIRAAQKVLIVPESGGDREPVGSRLAYTDAAPAPQMAELADWEETAGWQADGDLDMDQVELQQRELRLQQLQKKRDQRRTGR